MKNLFLLWLFSLSTSPLIASESPKKFKPANDPCPQGTHEVVVTEQYRAITVKNNKDETVLVKETSKVCRDNKDSNLFERTSK